MKRRGGAKRRLLLALSIAATALFAALGVWQVERRAWKLDLIARVEARVHAPPVVAPVDANGQNPRDYEYRHVFLNGVFRHDRETLVQALTERGAGFWLITPLDTGRDTVLVNRGFVSPGGEPSRPAGPVRITGLIRASEPGGGFLRSNDPAAGRWYSRDVGAIAKARNLSGVAPYFVDADATPGSPDWPVGGLTVITFRNTHLVYALTWFGLALVSAYASFLLLRRR